jgi:hypothetical protein
VKNFFHALGRCVLEDATCVGGVLGLLVVAAACVFAFCFFYGFFQVAYELMFDPNAANIASRLSLVSISPEKWM